MGSLVMVSQHCIRDITFGDEYKTVHEGERWRKEKLRLKTGKEDWAVFLNGESTLFLGSLVTISQHCIRDITLGDKHKTGHDAEGWREENSVKKLEKTAGLCS